jgi:hypothetical protein
VTVTINIALIVEKRGIWRKIARYLAQKKYKLHGIWNKKTA